MQIYGFCWFSAFLGKENFLNFIKFYWSMAKKKTVSENAVHPGFFIVEQ